MKKIISIIILLSILIACKPSKEKKTKDENNSKKLIRQQEMKKVVDSLVLKYDIKYIWDSLDWKQYHYTIDFKPVINSKYQLISKYSIDDFYEKDTSEYISIETHRPEYYFDFPISKEQKKIILQTSDSWGFKNNTILVVSINDIRKIKLEIKGEVEGEDEDDKSAIINLENSYSFIGKGKIIDIVTIKNK